MVHIKLCSLVLDAVLTADRGSSKRGNIYFFMPAHFGWEFGMVLVSSWNWMKIEDFFYYLSLAHLFVYLCVLRKNAIGSPCFRRNVDGAFSRNHEGIDPFRVADNFPLRSALLLRYIAFFLLYIMYPFCPWNNT